ncbi:MAG: septal ring lytic transglycosylase RlpA family protein [Alphaproteobacteria bacterium]|nr:septal ring lytic transglycosylase RlpA family protein [Alphaproteobacteria bacterium]
MGIKRLLKEIVLLCCGILCLSSCTTGTPELSGMSPEAQARIIKDYGGIYKVGNPYKVAGRWYYPKEDYNYIEEGMASWYGEDFNGKKTANGERYNMNTLTAAHRTLPLPSIVKVTNLQNGRSVVLRVNDRGPYVKDRIIDLSKRGAQLLGYMGQGTTRVRVEIMAKESKELKEAMLTGRVTSPTQDFAQAPAPSLYESSEERRKISAEVQKADEAAIYAESGGKKVATGTYKPTGQTAEPVVYGSAASADGKVKSGALGVMNAADIKTSDNKGVYGTAAANPQKESSKAVKSNTYQYMKGYYYIHTGAFSSYTAAHQQLVRLKEYGSSHIVPYTKDGKKYYRVSMGPYSRREEAQVAQAKIRYYGFKDTIIEQK